MKMRSLATLGGLVTLVVACSAPPRSTSVDASTPGVLLPTGVRLDPAGVTTDLGSFPVAMVLTPGRDAVVVLLNGYREQGIQVVERNSGRVRQTVLLPAACLGIAFSPDGRTLYVSGGNQDVVYRFDWADSAALRDSIVLGTRTGNRGTRYPAGLALSPDGRTLYVAENLGDSLAIIDVATGLVTKRLATGRYPYGVAVAADRTVYVSAWGENWVAVFIPGPDNTLVPRDPLMAGRHPSALLLNDAAGRLFIASASTDRVIVADTRAHRVIGTINDTPPGGPGEGSTPNALALSADNRRLYIAEADNNAVAIVDLSARLSGIEGARGGDTVAARVPVGWYPTSVLALGDTLLATNAKGRGTGPNPGGPNPWKGGEAGSREYTLGQLSGTLTTFSGARADAGSLAPLSARVASANRWTTTRRPHTYPPIEHVIYIVKENRTYDQVLGDLPGADGDSSLVFFPRPVSPNHHALAERFGIYDRFFVNAEVSADGHNWSTAAYATDYTQKMTQQSYSGRGRSYDYEGTNRGQIVEDDVAEPAAGYLWDLAQRKGITFRTYGEFVIQDAPPANADSGARAPRTYRGVKPFLAANVSPDYPQYDLSIKDQRRADVWIRELREFSARGRMPTLEIVRLPNDHTSGARAGRLSPSAMMADNDLALGRIIEALSRSPFWKSTVVFVVEDDAQNGADHVDSHRSLLYVISPWARAGVHHRFVNTTDVIATIEEILGLGTLSQFDHFGRPLREVWTETPDLRPYSALVPSVSLDEINPKTGRAAILSEQLQLAEADMDDDELMSRILWMAIKGESVPWPGRRRMSAEEMRVTRR